MYNETGVVYTFRPELGYIYCFSNFWVAVADRAVKSVVFSFFLSQSAQRISGNPGYRESIIVTALRQLSHRGHNLLKRTCHYIIILPVTTIFSKFINM